MKRLIPFVIVALGVGPALALAADLRAIHVDAGKSIGTLRSLQGVNGAPAPNMHKPSRFTFGGWNIPADTDATAGYRQARIDVVRTHDGYGPGDIDARFPDAPNVLIDPERTQLSMFPNPDADPKDPRSDTIPGDMIVGGVPSTYWGLHRVDMALVTGNLLDDIDAQAAAWLEAAR